MVDEQGRLVYANEAFGTCWDLPEVLSASTTEPELVALLRTRMEDDDALTRLLEETGSSPDGDVDLRLRSGRVLSSSVAPLLREGDPGGRVWTFRDRTERRWMQEEQKRAEERVRTSHKLESLGVLASGIAHDFNNILVGIIGNVELAQAQLEASSSASEPLSRVRRSADRAADAVSVSRPCSASFDATAAS